MKKIVLWLIGLVAVGALLAFFCLPRHDKLWRYHIADAEQLKSHSGRIMVKMADNDSLVLSDANGDSLVSYIRVLHSHPQQRLWMVVENLSEENIGAFTQAFGDILAMNGVLPSQVVMETERWDLTFRLTARGAYVATPFDAPAPGTLEKHEADSVITRLSRVVESGCVSALIIPGPWFGTLRHQFAGKNIQFLIASPDTWPMRILLSPRRRLLSDPCVKAVAVK